MLPVNTGSLGGRFDPWAGKMPPRRAGSPTPCSCLENPWTEEPSGLQSIGLQLSMPLKKARKGLPLLSIVETFFRSHLKHF